MAFVYDTKGSNSLSGDGRSSAGSLSYGNKSSMGFTWGDDFNTWAQELRTWAEAVSSLSLDTKH